MKTWVRQQFNAVKTPAIFMQKLSRFLRPAHKASVKKLSHTNKIMKHFATDGPISCPSAFSSPTKKLRRNDGSQNAVVVSSQFLPL